MDVLGIGMRIGTSQGLLQTVSGGRLLQMGLREQGGMVHREIGVSTSSGLVSETRRQVRNSSQRHLPERTDVRLGERTGWLGGQPSGSTAEKLWRRRGRAVFFHPCLSEGIGECLDVSRLRRCRNPANFLESWHFSPLEAGLECGIDRQIRAFLFCLPECFRFAAKSAGMFAVEGLADSPGEPVL